MAVERKSPTSGGFQRLVPVPQPPNLAEGLEHRGFDRRSMELAVGLRRGEAQAPSFTATLRSDNLSMSGMFVRSTFFLPVGTELELTFSLPGETHPVQVHAELVRHQGEPLSGLGLRFDAFRGQSEVALARLFLNARLQAFIGRYLASARAKGLSEAERLVDALAAWELDKVTTGLDPWAP